MFLLTLRGKLSRAQIQLVDNSILQLPLFSPRTALPSRPFSRWSRKFDEIRICARCGREIVTRRTRQGEVVGEFVSESGTC
jgi:hypothetical protein